MDLLTDLGIPVVAASIAAAAGAFFGATTSYWKERRQKAEDKLAEKKNLAAALSGEMRAIVQLIELKRYPTHYRLISRRLAGGKDYRFPPANTGEEFFAAYRGNVGRLGILPAELSEQVASLYTLFMGAQEDMRTTLMPEWNSSAIAERLIVVRRVASQLITICTIAKDLSIRLHDYARAN